MKSPTTLIFLALVSLSIASQALSSREESMWRRAKRSIFIVPGTFWCGAGNRASTCDDLGEYQATDKCCREHDACPYTFSYNQPAYNGYFSEKFYSVSHCECDHT